MSYSYGDKFAGVRRDNNSKGQRSKEVARRVIESLRRNGSTMTRSAIAKRAGCHETTLKKIIDELDAWDVVST